MATFAAAAESAPADTSHRLPASSETTRGVTAAEGAAAAGEPHTTG